MLAQKDLLDKWSQRINTDKIEETLGLVKKAMADYRNFPPTVKVAFYLHGSQKHGTNIEYNTPLDVIIEINSVTASSNEGSDPFLNKKYSFDSFKSDVIQSFQQAFGKEAVSEGVSSIHLLGSANRQAVNVLVCFKYKLVIVHGRDETEKMGVAFYHKKSRDLIVNFPKQHLSNETIKDKGAQGNFVPMVRIFKNMQKHLAEKGELDAARVPAYFLESFISNAPSGMFTDNYLESVEALLDFWAKNDWSNYLAIDGFRSLWGDYPQSWNVEDATYFFEVLKKNWRKGEAWQFAAMDE